MSSSCELVNTYEVLEHVMGIKGLHPHRLDTIRDMMRRLAQHVSNNAVLLAEGIVLDIGCGSGAGTRELAAMFGTKQQIIGIDINLQAIEHARTQYNDMPNLQFHHGDIKSFLSAQPNLKISAAICISVSMFIHDVSQFYRDIFYALMEGGIFIDAPFMFREAESEKFHHRTYSVCGCNMNMFQINQLQLILSDAGFENMNCIEHNFDLMKLPILFHDYPARFLMGNFLKNIISPPEYFGKITSTYLLIRTLRIFLFFLKNKHRYAGGELVAMKGHSEQSGKLTGQ